MQCPECGSSRIRKNVNRRGKQHHICVDCARQFIDDYTSMRGYSDETHTPIQASLAGGFPKCKLKADKVAGVIELDSVTSLSGIPAIA